jgi:hypothetical protein
MHAKIQLLKYPKHLRVVIPTGNLTAYDWGETGVLENVLQKREKYNNSPSFLSLVRTFLTISGLY